MLTWQIFPQKHTKKALEFGRGGPKKGYVILTFARNQANSYQFIVMLPNLVEVYFSMLRFCPKSGKFPAAFDRFRANSHMLVVIL